MNKETANEPEYDGYARLTEEVKRRWKEPSKHPTFALFFVASFLIFAATGVWLEFCKLIFGFGSPTGSPTGSTAALRTAIATYFPAVLGSAILQLIISDALRSLRALSMIIGPAFAVLAFMLVFWTDLPDWIAIFLGVFASIAALACWRVVYADDLTLRDDPVPEVTTGRIDPVAPLLGDNALDDFEA